jgi:hypothetical protein
MQVIDTGFYFILFSGLITLLLGVILFIYSMKSQNQEVKNFSKLLIIGGVFFSFWSSYILYYGLF